MPQPRLRETVRAIRCNGKLCHGSPEVVGSEPSRFVGPDLLVDGGTVNGRADNRATKPGGRSCADRRNPEISARASELGGQGAWGRPIPGRPDYRRPDFSSAHIAESCRRAPGSRKGRRSAFSSNGSREEMKIQETLTGRARPLGFSARHPTPTGSGRVPRFLMSTGPGATLRPGIPKFPSISWCGRRSEGWTGHRAGIRPLARP